MPNTSESGSTHHAEAAAPSLLKGPWRLSLIFVLLLIGVAAVIEPKDNFDGVFYTALVSHATTPIDLQQAGLQFLHPSSEEAQSPYGEDMRSNPIHFQEQLPFYFVKPLYILLLKTVSAAGLGLRAGAFLSACSFVLLGFLISSWLRRYYSAPVSVLLSALLLLNPTMLQLTRWTSPDTLAILIVIGAVYLILEPQRPLAACLLLISGIWIRPEIIIFSGITFCALFVAHKLSLWRAAALSVLALSSYFFIVRNGYPFSTQFYSSIVERLNAPGEVHIVLTRGMYLNALKHAIQHLSAENPLVALPVILCALIFLIAPAKSILKILPAASLLASLIFFMAYPHIEARYYIANLFFIPALIFLTQIGSLLNPSVRSRQL